MARGLLLNVDIDAMSITLAHEYLPWNQTVSPSQGSMQEQTNGNYILGRVTRLREKVAKKLTHI